MRLSGVRRKRPWHYIESEDIFCQEHSLDVGDVVCGSNVADTSARCARDRRKSVTGDHSVGARGGSTAWEGVVDGGRAESLWALVLA